MEESFFFLWNYTHNNFKIKININALDIEKNLKYRKKILNILSFIQETRRCRFGKDLHYYNPLGTMTAISDVLGILLSGETFILEPQARLWW